MLRLCISFRNLQKVGTFDVQPWRWKSPPFVVFANLMLFTNQYSNCNLCASLGGLFPRS